MDLEVARADRHLDPVAVAARRRRAPARRPTRRRRRSAARGAPAAGARASSRRSGSVSSARGQSCLQLARRARAASTATQPPSSSTSAGAVPASPTTTAPSGTSRLLADARRELGVRHAAAAPRPPRAGLDPRLERRVEDERPAGRAREQLDRAVVVGRAEPARDDEQVVAEARREAPPRARRARRRRSRTSAGSMPSESSDRARNGPFRSVRSPRTSSEPVTTIAARGRVSRRATPLGVTVSTQRPVAGATGRACRATVIDEVLGRADVEPEPLARERLGLAPARPCPGRGSCPPGRRGGRRRTRSRRRP